MKPNFTNAFFQKTRCLRTVLRRAVVCMLLLGTTVVHAQERKITVDTRQEVTLVQFFRQVEASSDYLFNYKDQDVADIRVSVKVADASIQEVMDLALARTSLTYTVKGRHVIIGQSAARSAGTPGTDSRPVALTGRVTDEKGMPFVGVTVIQEGTTNGCVTDADGNYKWDETGFPMNKLKVVVIDPDSIYENDSTEITLKQTEKGDGDWYDGKYEGKADFKLKKRK